MKRRENFKTQFVPKVLIFGQKKGLEMKADNTLVLKKN